VFLVEPNSSRVEGESSEDVSLSIRPSGETAEEDPVQPTVASGETALESVANLSFLRVPEVEDPIMTNVSMILPGGK